MLTSWILCCYTLNWCCSHTVHGGLPCFINDIVLIILAYLFWFQELCETKEWCNNIKALECPLVVDVFDIAPNCTVTPREKETYVNVIKVTALAFFFRNIYFCSTCSCWKSVFVLFSSFKSPFWNRSGWGKWASAMHAEIPYNEIAPNLLTIKRNHLNMIYSHRLISNPGYDFQYSLQKILVLCVYLNTGHYMSAILYWYGKIRCTLEITVVLYLHWYCHSNKFYIMNFT